MANHFNAAVLKALLAVIDGIVDDILEDTGTTIPGTITTLQAAIDAVQADLGDVADAGAEGVVTNADTAIAYLKQLVTFVLTGVEGIPEIRRSQDAELDTARGTFTKTMTGGEDDLYGESSDTEFRLEEFRVDLHNMVEGDSIVFRVYTTEDGTERKISSDLANIFTGVQDPARVEIIGSLNQVWGREDISITAQQTDGTNREIVCYWRDSKRGS